MNPVRRIDAVPWAAALAGMAVLLAATRGVPGVSPDSTQYLAAARSVLAGDGLQSYWWREGSEPLTQFPPLFSLAIAALAWIGLGAEQAAWLLNLVLLPVNVLLAARLARRMWGSPAGSALVAAAVALAPDVLTAHAMVWSEPLFLTLLLLSLSFAARSLRDDRGIVLIASAVLAGAAAMTRYAGVVMIGTGALVQLMADRSWSRRFGRAFTFGTIASIPLVAWLLRNALAGGSATNRVVAIHWIESWKWLEGAKTAWRWVMPEFPSGLSAVWLLVALLAAIALGIGAARSAATSDDDVCTAPYERRVAATFVVCYVGFIALSMMLFDALIFFQPRLMIPAFVVVAALVVPPVIDAVLRSRRLAPTILAATIFGTIGSAYLLSSLWFARRAHRDGLGYEAHYWQRSAVLAATRALPPDARCLSNAPEAVRYVTGRPCAIVPPLFGAMSRLPNESYDDDLARIRRDAAASPTYVVYFHGFGGRYGTWYLPTAEELSTRLPLEARMSDATGFVAEVVSPSTVTRR